MTSKFTEAVQGRIVIRNEALSPIFPDQSHPRTETDIGRVIVSEGPEHQTLKTALDPRKESNARVPTDFVRSFVVRPPSKAGLPRSSPAPQRPNSGTQESLGP
ncbi:MAG: hypothetical protein CBC48_10080 [bacterium TMED88]|nr:hypothetical protein [Deltaproteobacteria bacterium]OUV30925.1 MAG: hypothetical protein CBC48_10080 [bacterium TMED88]